MNHFSESLNHLKGVRYFERFTRILYNGQVLSNQSRDMQMRVNDGLERQRAERMRIGWLCARTRDCLMIGWLCEWRGNGKLSLSLWLSGVSDL